MISENSHQHKDLWIGEYVLLVVFFILHKFVAKSCVKSLLGLLEMKHNFFENRSTEYTRAALTGTWDDAFVIHDKERSFEF